MNTVISVSDMTIISDYPCDWGGESIECPSCGKEIYIDDVYWN